MTTRHAPYKDARTGAQKAGDRIRASVRRDARTEERNSLTPAEIHERMVQAIIKATYERGTVSRADLIAANIPAPAIGEHFGAALNEALKRDPKIRKIVDCAA